MQYSATFFLTFSSYQHSNKLNFMATLRYLLLSFMQKNRVHVNPKVSFYILLVAFVILLLATESIIKQTFVPL